MTCLSSNLSYLQLPARYLTRRMSAVRARQHPPIKSTACTLLGSAREAQDRQRGTSAGLGNAVGRRQEIPELRRAVVGRHAS